MVEYALLLGTTSFRAIGSDIGAWLSTLQWNTLGYGVLAVAALSIALWAFRTE